MEKLIILMHVMKDEDRKPVYQILKELIHCFLLEREVPYYYFLALLYKDKTRDYKNYVSHSKLEKINMQYDSIGSFTNLENKVKFSEILESNSIPTPHTLAYNNKRTLFIGDSSVIMNNVDDLTRLINEMIYLSKSKGVFVKRVGGHGGALAFKFSESKVDVNDVSELFNLTHSANFIFQDLVIQHEAINQIYPNSINTIRVNAFFDRNINELNIISALMRFGSGDSVIDNASQGGFFVPVDIENWSSEGIGRSFLKNGGNLYKTHPNTQHLLDGTKIPFGESIHEILNKAAPLFEQDLVGWDVAITTEGPVIIEGNHNLHFGMAQMACGGFKNHEGYRKILRL